MENLVVKEMNRLNIAVIGLGFVGLTTSLGLADKGHNVTGYDKDENKSVLISKGKTPFLEPGLQQALDVSLNKTFNIAESMEKAVCKADVIFFCVGTPCDSYGDANLNYLIDAVKEAARYANKDAVFTVKSTVPPLTIRNILTSYCSNFSLAMNPEFLREGHAWEDFIFPDRIVIGCESDNAWKKLNTVYSDFECSVHRTSTTTAEFIKYLSNSMLATMISFSNEMAGLAECLGDINIADAFHILWEDKRIKNSGIAHYLYPGCGYGGSCLPKDTTALLSLSKKEKIDMPLLSSVVSINNNMASKTARKIIKYVNSSRSQNIGILGLSFNPGSDDVRNSPAAGIIEELSKLGCKDILVYDPVANLNFKSNYNMNEITYCDSVAEVFKFCDIVAVVTTWDEFKGLKIKYPNKTIIDCRYFLDGET